MISSNLTGIGAVSKVQQDGFHCLPFTCHISATSISCEPWMGAYLSQVDVPKPGSYPLLSYSPSSLSPSHPAHTSTCKPGLGHVTTHAVSQAIYLQSIAGPSLLLTCVSLPSRHQLCMWPDPKFLSSLVPLFHPVTLTGPRWDPCTAKF